MLQKIREKITGWVAWTIVITIGVVFAVWGIDLSFTPRPKAAEVNGAEVPVEPVRRAYQDQVARFQQAFSGDVPEEIANEIRRGVIEQFVSRELLQQRVVGAGYRVSDAEVAAQVQSYEAFQIGGEFSLEAYRAALQGAGYTPALFEEEQRRLLEVQQLQDAIVLSSFVTPAEVDQRVALERELREVEWVSWPLDRFLADVEVTEAEVEARYRDNPERWMTPETVDLAYVMVRLEDLAADIEVTEDNLRAYYESEVSREPERFLGLERRKTAHILLTGDDAEEQIQVLRDRIEAGEDFAAVAAEASDDPGSASQGGDLGWVERGMMVPAFEDALFAMEAGTVSAPVRSEFGWHLIRLEEIEQSGGASFEEVRDELLAEYRSRQAEDRYYDDAEALAQLAFENPDSLEPAAEALGYDIAVVEGVTRQGGPGIASNPSVLSAAWSESVFEQRENSTVIEVGEGEAAVLRIADYHPPEQRPLQEVAEQIRTELRREGAAARIDELAAEAETRLAAGEPVADVAADLSGDHVAGLTVVREDVTAPPPVVRAAFAAPRPAGTPEVSRAQGPNGEFVVRVLSVTPGGLDMLRPEEQRQLRDRARGAQASQELQAYLEDMRARAEVEVYENALQ